MKLVVLLVLNMLAAGLAGFAQETPPTPQDPMAALGAIFGANTNPVVHHSQLKALLPTEFAGMKRTNMEAGKLPSLGFSISYAEAEFSNDESNLRAKISDVGGMGK